MASGNPPSVSFVIGNPQIVEHQEAAAGSANDFYKGDLVKLTSGELVIATAGAILGIALKAATGTASTAIPVLVVNPIDIYVAKYKASATAESLKGSVIDFVFTAGAHTLDDSGATTDAVVYDLDPRDAEGDSGGRLLFKFQSTACQSTA